MGEDNSVVRVMMWMDMGWSYRYMMDGVMRLV